MLYVLIRSASYPNQLRDVLLFVCSKTADEILALNCICTKILAIFKPPYPGNILN